MTQIKIDISDWADEYRESEPDVSSKDALVRMQMTTGLGPQRLGRLAIVGRARGDAPDDILSPNKLLLNACAALEISQDFATRKRQITAPNGKKYSVRELVAPVREPPQDNGGDGDFELAVELLDGKGTSYVDVESPEALDRAESYMRRRVPGYIWGRLLIIAAIGGNVKDVADWLHDEIDSMVGRLI